MPAMSEAWVIRPAAHCAERVYACHATNLGRPPPSAPKLQSTGQYDVAQVVSLQHSVQERTESSSRRGAFGSVGPRFYRTDPGSNPAGDAFSGRSAMAATVAAAYAGGGVGEGGAIAGAGRGAAAGEWLHQRGVKKPTSVFVSATRRFEGRGTGAAAAAAPAMPDYASWDGREGTLWGDPAKLGPGSHFRLEEWWRASKGLVRGGSSGGGGVIKGGVAAAGGGMGFRVAPSRGDDPPGARERRRGAERSWGVGAEGAAAFGSGAGRPSSVPVGAAAVPGPGGWGSGADVFDGNTLNVLPS